MINIKLIERQPHWRVAAVHLFAKLMGVLVHVEGFPFGSSRLNSARKEDVDTKVGILGEIGRIA